MRGFSVPLLLRPLYQLGNRPGYGFIFERGGYDGFSPDEVNTFLDVSGRVSQDAASYEFRNVGQLDSDFRAGRFAPAFAEQRELDAPRWPESGEPEPGRAFLTSHDRRAVAAYEEHCQSHGIPASEAGREEWIREWRNLSEEQRQDAVNVERDMDF